MKYFVKAKLSDNISETPEGFLLCLNVPIARTGEMVYGEGETPLATDSKGEVVISRSDNEVFRPQTIASFEGKPITIAHPDEFVNPDNWRQLAKGTMQNIRRGAGEYKDSLLADLLITDSMAINLVKNGLREVSCGYEADYEQTEDGKGVQKNIIGNHLALVDQGRAGSNYAINDHKGAHKMGLKDKITAIFAKAQDEAMKIADDEGEQTQQDPSSGKPAMAKDAYDELVNMVKDLSSKIDAMKPKDEAVAPPKEKDNVEGGKQANDDDASMENRLKALESAVSKLLEKKAAGDDGDDDDSTMDDDDDVQDDDFEESSMVGDTASRAEILAPGIEVTKDVKAKALKAAYATKEGKRVIDSVNGGKAPAYDSKEKVDMLFIAASELLKVTRTKELSQTKQTRDVDGTNVNAGYKTAEELNAINEKFYQNRH